METNNKTIKINRLTLQQFKNDEIILAFLKDFSVYYGSTPMLVGSRGCIGNTPDPRNQMSCDYDFVDTFYPSAFDEYCKVIYRFTYVDTWTESTSNPKYLDSECRKILCITLVDGRKIDIVFRKDVEFYISCLELLTVDFYKDFLWKSSDTFLPSGLSIIERRPYINQRFEELFTIKRRLDMK